MQEETAENELCRSIKTNHDLAEARRVFTPCPQHFRTISMDGSMRYYPGLVKMAGDVNPERMPILLLFFTAEDANFLEDRDKYYDGPAADIVGPNVLNAWIHGDLLTVNMLGMAHPQFQFDSSTQGERAALCGISGSRLRRDDANTSHAWVALYTLNLLNAYLKHDASAKVFLERTPAGNGVPKHFMGITFRPAQKVSPPKVR